jgi:hypothetical protein
MAIDRSNRVCPVCRRPFRKCARPGGKPHVYCSTNCRHRHRQALVAFTAKLEADGKVMTADVMATRDQQPNRIASPSGDLE